MYGLYQRNNIDGSESESVMRLVDNLKMNEGKEISLEPNKRMQIKVWHCIWPYYNTATAYDSNTNGFSLTAGYIQEYRISDGV